ncbi:Hypothetical predicted protein, partial [Mytilus galloprovincialis]
FLASSTMKSLLYLIRCLCLHTRWNLLCIHALYVTMYKDKYFNIYHFKMARGLEVKMIQITNLFSTMVLFSICHGVLSFN